MPKIKTHSRAKKTYKVTGSGKITHEQSNMRHLMTGKPSKRTRRLEKDAEVKAPNVKRTLRLLGKR
ncbi:MAG: 50S ribosomal protein L35 [actinobacterium acAMD-5]|jgi:large subunit ribosomal protein L35|nr:MAG: 50S ribosomal protein L35 [actinobacterium acAMD-5]